MTESEIPQRVLIDIDGVCYLKGVPIPGAASAVSALARCGHVIAYITNNSWDLPATYASSLDQLGFPASTEQVATSSMAAAQLLLEGSEDRGLPRLEPGAVVAVMGGPGVFDALDRAGFRALSVDSAREIEVAQIQALVVGIDRDLTYRRLTEAARLAREGCAFVATNTDKTYPTERGPVPGAGAIVEAVRVASEIDPIVAGKPESGLARAAEAIVGRGKTLMIGDRIETDITFARRHGYVAALVLTGVSQIEDLAVSHDVPDLVGETLDQVITDPVTIAFDEDAGRLVARGPRVLSSRVNGALSMRTSR